MDTQVYTTAEIERITRMQAHLPPRIQLVFDGRESSRRFNLPSTRVELLYSSAAQSADLLIEELVRRHPDPAKVNVVSSDRRIVSAAKTCGAQVVSARDFAQQLAERLAPSSKGQAADDKPASSSADVDYWMGIFKEPPPKPPKRPKGSQPKR